MKVRGLPLSHLFAVLVLVFALQLLVLGHQVNKLSRERAAAKAQARGGSSELGSHREATAAIASGRVTGKARPL